MNKRVKQGSNSWRFIIAIKAEQTSRELEMKQMGHDATIVPLTKKQKKKELKLARSKVRYDNATLPPHDNDYRVPPCPSSEQEFKFQSTEWVSFLYNEIIPLLSEIML